MRSTSLKRSGWLLAAAMLAIVPCLFSGQGLLIDQADADGPVLRQPKPITGEGSRADHGEARLERLPWNVNVLRADLSSKRPVAVAGFYLMDKHIITVTQDGVVYCQDRFNLQHRWVSMLKAPLFRAPTESPTHFCFLTKDYKGVYWLHAISKRSGAEGALFPRRLPFAASSGVAASGSMAYMGSLGSPRNNKTFESVNLITGRMGWGYRATGLIYGSPATDPDGDAIVFATDDGVVTSLPGGVMPPDERNWSYNAGSTIKGGVATTPKHVIAANRDGMVYCLSIDTGKVLWLQSVTRAVNSTPWVLGSWTSTERDTGIEGAAKIKVRDFNGTAFVRNVSGLHAFDLATGEKQFNQKDNSRPLVRNGKWVVTVNEARLACFRNAEDGFKAAGERLDLSMFDLIPTNGRDGAIYACTADGSIVAAIPTR